MEIKSRQVSYYVALNGKSHFNEWLAGLKDPVGLAAAAARLIRLKSGNLGDFKSVGSIVEFRIDSGPGYRIYAGLDGLTLIVLLAGGDKKSQKGDIAKAELFWKEYLERKRKNAGTH